MKSNISANLTSAFLLFSALVMPAISRAAAPGLLFGICQIQIGSSTKSFGFHLPANAKIIVGFTGLDDGDYKISIVNNTGVTANEAAWYSLGIGFARDNGRIRNPPLLCPTSPEEARQICLEENRRNNPPHIIAPRDVFTQIENDGAVDSEAVFTGPGKFGFNGSQIPSESVRDGLLITTPPASLGGVGIACRAQFKQQSK